MKYSTSSRELSQPPTLSDFSASSVVPLSLTTYNQRDIAALKALYDQYANSNTIKVKRQLWQNLPTAALGEIASTPTQLDDLFVRHTYLSAVIGMVVQASMGIDIYRLAETDPADLLHGRDFRSKTGLQGVVESDFFTWPVEVGGLPLLKTLARRVAIASLRGPFRCLPKLRPLPVLVWTTSLIEHSTWARHFCCFTPDSVVAC